ncbi:MAG: hypothetical protein IPL71_23900 [Anaerolineales bacterium]|uniref:hypothetical protein n=1 Tax=Candidatus Villigracilis proximus TaxID=3140683 RepID=UPI003136FCF6|nr:hypothetical protein [Anaerolineales bacterium]
MTTYFVGNHYEVANGVVTKYYYAGTQRIAMRKNNVLTYMLTDHLGSTSLNHRRLGQCPLGDEIYCVGRSPLSSWDNVHGLWVV